MRATTADENGNLSFEEEAAYVNARAIAMATRASGGIVVAQVKTVSYTHLDVYKRQI